jgi:hypothetical protein
VKFRILVSAVTGVAICATVSAAQVCQGDLSFRSASKHLDGALVMSANATSFGAGMTAGHREGLYGGASIGMLDINNVDGNSLMLNGGVGYSMPLQAKSKWQLCPGGTLSLSFGPTITTGAGAVHVAGQTLTMGASVGTVVPLSKTVNMLPFGSAAFGYTRATAKLNGTSASQTDGYLLLGAGAGFQFTPSFVVRPAISLAAGADIIDDTVFSLGLTFALPH